MQICPENSENLAKLRNIVSHTVYIFICHILRHSILLSLSPLLLNVVNVAAYMMTMVNRYINYDDDQVNMFVAYAKKTLVELG